MRGLSLIVFLQETHADKNCEKLWMNEWGSKIYFSNGSQNARGVAVLLNRNLNVQIHMVDRDDQGRYIVLYVTLNKSKWLLINVYAPNEDEPDFFVKLFQIVNRYSPDQTLISGDLNLGLEPIINRSGKGCNNDKLADWLKNYFELKQLVDIWRYMYPDKNGYIWRRLKPKPVFSRLDYMIASESILQIVDKMNILLGFRTDHSALELKVALTQEKKGIGYWKFNTSLLKDKDYIESINRLIEIELETNQNLSPKKRWELLKIAIRGSTIQFAS